MTRRLARTTAVPHCVLPVGDQPVVAAHEAGPEDALRLRIDVALDLPWARPSSWSAPAAYAEGVVRLYARHGDDNGSEIAGELPCRAGQLRMQSTLREKVREVGDPRVRHELLSSTPVRAIIAGLPRRNGNQGRDSEIRNRENARRGT